MVAEIKEATLDDDLKILQSLSKKTNGPKKVETRTSALLTDGIVSNDKVTELVTEKIEEVKNLISGLASGI